MFDRLEVERILGGSFNAFRLLCPSGHIPFLFGLNNPRRVYPEDLLGHAEHMQALKKNISGFSANLPPVPTLLYGHRGTGKTSLILSLWNDWNREHPGFPLKIIQADRHGIDFLPPLIDHLSTRTELFILLLDDLTFPEEDASFHQLKALLDGGVIAASDNTGLVVTSNIRHLVSESKHLSADSLHPDESRDDSLALYERFGLALFFEEPSLEEYLLLVLTKSWHAGLLPDVGGDWKERWTDWTKRSSETRMDPSDKDIRILRGAVRFSREKASRSGRVAQRFVDLLSRDLIQP